MATSTIDERIGAEVVHGAEECYKKSIELLEELGFPKGVLPLKDLEECGRNRDTGFVWMKQRTSYEHFFEKPGTRVIYAPEVTAYVEPGKMTRMTGVKSKQMILWVPIAEMSVVEAVGRRRKKIMFRTPVGLGRAFRATDFMTAEEVEIYEAEEEVRQMKEADAEIEAQAQGKAKEAEPDSSLNVKI